MTKGGDLRSQILAPLTTPPSPGPAQIPSENTVQRLTDKIGINSTEERRADRQSQLQLQGHYLVVFRTRDKFLSAWCVSFGLIYCKYVVNLSPQSGRKGSVEFFDTMTLCC